MFIAAAVGRLRDEADEVHTWGSGELVRSLLAEGLVDRLSLWMYPISLGTGKRLFDTGTVPVAFRPAQPAHVFDSGAWPSCSSPRAMSRPARWRPPRRSELPPALVPDQA